MQQIQYHFLFNHSLPPSYSEAYWEEKEITQRRTDRQRILKSAKDQVGGTKWDYADLSELKCRKMRRINGPFTSLIQLPE